MEQTLKPTYQSEIQVSKKNHDVDSSDNSNDNTAGINSLLNGSGQNDTDIEEIIICQPRIETWAGVEEIIRKEGWAKSTSSII